MIDPDWLRMREVAVNGAVALARTNSVNLFDHPTVHDPEALRLVRVAHARARELGLTLPAFPGTQVEFVCAPGSAVGAQTRKRDGVIEMIFNIVPGQPLGEAFVRLALHELVHVHQYACNVWLDAEQSEREAETFAWGAMLGWQWGAGR